MTIDLPPLSLTNYTWGFSVVPPPVIDLPRSSNANRRMGQGKTGPTICFIASTLPRNQRMFPVDFAGRFRLGD